MAKFQRFGQSLAVAVDFIMLQSYESVVEEKINQVEYLVFGLRSLMADLLRNRQELGSGSRAQSDDVMSQGSGAGSVGSAAEAA